MADCVFKRQCERDAIFWQTCAAHYAHYARVCPFSYDASYYQKKAAKCAHLAMINLFAII